MVQGDTDRIATGAGTGGSSSIPAGGGPSRMSRNKARRESEGPRRRRAGSKPARSRNRDGAVQVAGTDRAISFADLAKRPEATDEKLTAADAFTPPAPTYPNGTHVAEVEIDPATGATEIVNYVVVDDFGVTLNPLMLAGPGAWRRGAGHRPGADGGDGLRRRSGQLVTAS